VQNAKGSKREYSGTGRPKQEHKTVGSFKLYVSFAEYSLFYRALLQKRPVILRSLLIVATPFRKAKAAAQDSARKSEKYARAM